MINNNILVCCLVYDMKHVWPNCLCFVESDYSLCCCSAIEAYLLNIILGKSIITVIKHISLCISNLNSLEIISQLKTSGIKLDHYIGSIIYIKYLTTSLHLIDPITSSLIYRWIWLNMHFRTLFKLQVKQILIIQLWSQMRYCSGWFSEIEPSNIWQRDFSFN